MLERDHLSACPACTSKNTQRKLNVPFFNRRTVAEEAPENRDHDGVTDVCGTGIKMNSCQDMDLNSISLSGLDTAIDIKNSGPVRGRDWSLKANRVGINSENSEVDVKGLNIE